MKIRINKKNEKSIGNISYMGKYINFLTTKMSWDEINIM